VAEGNGKGSSITDKSQIPSTKLQINHNFQNYNDRNNTFLLVWDFGHLVLEFIWDLEFAY
jgi:hypothetical protein